MFELPGFELLLFDLGSRVLSTAGLFLWDGVRPAVPPYRGFFLGGGAGRGCLWTMQGTGTAGLAIVRISNLVGAGFG